MLLRVSGEFWYIATSLIFWFNCETREEATTTPIPLLSANAEAI